MARTGWRMARIFSAVRPASTFESSPAVVLPSRSRRFIAGQADGLAELEQLLAVEVHHLVEELAEVVPVLAREVHARVGRLLVEDLPVAPAAEVFEVAEGREIRVGEDERLDPLGGEGRRVQARPPPPKLWPTSLALSRPDLVHQGEDVGRVVGRGVARWAGRRCSRGLGGRRR